MARVELKGLTKRYGATTVLESTDLAIANGEFLTLLGPSGCGKTTMLRLVAGLVEPTAGQILIDGEDVTSLPARHRAVGMVFQDYALFPHLTVAENIGFGLRERGGGREAVRKRVAELLELVHLERFGNRRPTELSGGQQQRVALARAIAFPPRVLLMDEPFAALDRQLREQMQIEVRRIQRSLGITTIFVTHDQSEAMSLSDSIAVMNGGQVLQFGAPEDIHERPRSRFVADFVGQFNFIEARSGTGLGAWSWLEADGLSIRVPSTFPVRTGANTIGVRPRDLVLIDPNARRDDRNIVEAVVVSRMFQGNLCRLSVEFADVRWTVEMAPTQQGAREGDTVSLAWRPEHSVVFGA